MLIKIKYDLEEDYIVYSSFDEINNYDNVVYICCSNNQLTSLPNLPNSLQELWCDNNQLTVLPELPNSLQLLYYKNNQLIKFVKHKYLVKIIF